MAMLNAFFFQDEKNPIWEEDACLADENIWSDYELNFIIAHKQDIDELILNFDKGTGFNAKLHQLLDNMEESGKHIVHKMLLIFVYNRYGVKYFRYGVRNNIFSTQMVIIFWCKINEQTLFSPVTISCLTDYTTSIYTIDECDLYGKHKGNGVFSTNINSLLRDIKNGVITDKRRTELVLDIVKKQNHIYPLTNKYVLKIYNEIVNTSNTYAWMI